MTLGFVALGWIGMTAVGAWAGAPSGGDDLARMNFLRRLDGGLRAGRADATAWERQFVEDFLSQPRPFTGAQRQAVDVMREKFGTLSCEAREAEKMRTRGSAFLPAMRGK